MKLSWETFLEILAGEMESCDERLVRALLANKVLYLAGLRNRRLRETAEWRELNARRKAQLEAIAELAEVAEDAGLKIMVVKTFKLFPYVPDDVDVLLVDGEREELASRLLEKGYFLRSIGTPELTLRKIVDGTYVDLDIHHKLAAGEYRYVDNSKLWSNRRIVEVNGAKVPAPSWEDECAITVAHAVMKEFKILVADALQFLLCLRKGCLEEGRLKELGLSRAYEIFARAQARVLSGKARLPYRLPLAAVGLAYASNLATRLKREGVRPLAELAVFPRAKGIATLFRGP
jgi:hypothetical protein